MAKKVNGYIINHGGWIEFDQAPDDNGPWVPCTMVIADKAHERLFTESEVRAMMRTITHCTGSPVASIHIAEVRRVFAEEHGILLDPA